MKQPTQQQTQHLAGTARHYPEVLTWINECYMAELKQLPMVTVNTALAQGRCLVLGELVKQFTASLNAKP